MHTFAKIFVLALVALGPSACSTSRADSSEPAPSPTPVFEADDTRNPRVVEQQLDDLEQTLVKHDAGESAVRTARASISDANATRLPLRQTER